MYSDSLIQGVNFTPEYGSIQLNHHLAFSIKQGFQNINLHLQSECPTTNCSILQAHGYFTTQSSQEMVCLKDDNDHK